MQTLIDAVDVLMKTKLAILYVSSLQNLVNKVHE